MGPPTRTWKLYVACFYLFLFAPLAVVAVFAFNAGPYPTPPWRGFTFEWFVGAGAVFGRPGVLRDGPMLASLLASAKVALPVSGLAVALGTANAFLLERHEFPGKALLANVMLWPLVIPGVVLGISILAFSSRVANGLEDMLGTDLDFLRPGLPLVVAGQLSFILTISTLVISARLRRFDRALEEAARDLGAGPWRTLRTVTLPYLRPAMVGAALVAFLMSFENFNTTLVLVGAEPPLPVYMYGQMREGATPALNAVSLVLMLGTAAVATLFAAVSRKAD
jgi:spermidine/putrescine transport system permease protein